MIANGFTPSSSQEMLQRLSLLYNSSDKNARAHACIQSYASKHSTIDVGVGAASWIPGMTVPAILAAIAIQNKVIYQPLAKDLARIYISETDSYTNKLGIVASATTVAAEFAQEFALEFLVDHAKDMAFDLGLGALASLIPGVGVLAGATLDYLIAQMMTWRVGTMTAIYFQNGGEWVSDRKATMRIAEKLTGGIDVSAATVFNKSSKREVRVNFNSIPGKVPQVLEAGVRTILPVIKSISNQLPRSAVRESLLAMGISSIVVEAALVAFYSIA